jgi:[ribosomal protein S5]-alanine N-acetyltransferase
MLEISFTPFPLLTTDRMVLRAINLLDAPQLLRLRSEPETMKYLDKQPLQSLAEAALLIEKITEDHTLNNGISWAIALKDQPAVLIGTIGFWRIMKDHYRAEIGYMLLPEYCKKGLMKEAAAAVIGYGFTNMNLHSIEANINPGNLASEALLQSLGFIKEAYFKENFYFNGQFLDSAIYSLLHKAT